MLGLAEISLARVLLSLFGWESEFRNLLIITLIFGSASIFATTAKRRSIPSLQIHSSRSGQRHIISLKQGRTSGYIICTAIALTFVLPSGGGKMNARLAAVATKPFVLLNGSGLPVIAASDGQTSSASGHREGVPDGYKPQRVRTYVRT